MSAKKDFTGPFAPLCVKYVELKQAAGYDFKQQSRLLRCFDDFCKAYKIENYSITEDIAIAWSKQRPNESEVYRNSRIGVMQRFSQFLCMQGYPSYFLPSLPRAHSNHTPHIFTYDELHRIFYRLDDMQTTSAAPFRNLVMPVLISISCVRVCFQPFKFRVRKEYPFLDLTAFCVVIGSLVYQLSVHVEFVHSFFLLSILFHRQQA